jgi:hypothetical protein
VEMDFEAGVLKVRHGEGLDPRAAHLPLGMRSTLMLIPPLLTGSARRPSRKTRQAAPWAPGRSTPTSRSSRPSGPRSTASRMPSTSPPPAAFGPRTTGSTTPQ